MRGPPAVRLAARLDKNGPVHPVLKTRCWLWTGCTIRNGYGRMYVAGKNVLVHHVAWEAANGRPVPEGKWVLHHCDVRLCARGDHLFLGDQQANVDDMMAKGRYVNPNALKTECKRGHPFTPENTLREGRGGQRACRICVNASQLQRYYARKKQPFADSFRRST